MIEDLVEKFKAWREYRKDVTLGWKCVATIPCPLKGDGRGRSFTLFESADGSRRKYHHYGDSDYSSRDTDAYTYIVGPWVSGSITITPDILEHFTSKHNEILFHLMHQPSIDRGQSLIDAHKKYRAFVLDSLNTSGDFSTSVNVVRRALEMGYIKDILRSADYIEHEKFDNDDELYAEHVRYASKELSHLDGFLPLPPKLPTTSDVLDLYVLQVAKARK